MNEIFITTFQEYILQDVRNRQQLLVIHKKAKKTGFDLNQYNMLKQEAARVQYMLKKLRNPLKLKLPPKVTSTTDPGAANAATLGTIVAPTVLSSTSPVTTATKLTPATSVLEEKPNEKPSKDAPNGTSQHTTRK